MSPIRHPFVVVLVFVMLAPPKTQGSLIDTGDGELRHLDTVVHSSRIGTQFPSSVLPLDLNMNATMRLMTENEQLCEDDSLDLTGVVPVLRSSSKINSATTTSRLLNCAANKGATAAMILIEGQFPGMVFACSSFDKAMKAPIPLLEIASVQYEKVKKQAVDPVSSWTVQVVVDRNEWQDIFTSTTFLLVCRVFYTLLAGVALYRCAVCLMGHALNPAPHNKAALTTHWIPTQNIVMMVLVTEVLGSCLLIVYCSTGPLLSTDVLPIEIHFMLLGTPLAISALSSLVSISLFVRWGTLTQSGCRSTYEKLLIGSGLTVVTLTFLAGWLLLGGLITVNNYVALTSFLAAVSSTAALFIFRHAGKRFIKRIVDNRSRATSVTQVAVERRERSLRRFLAWIHMSTFANFLLIAPGVLLVVVSIMDASSPGFVVAMFFMFYLGAVVQSLSQSYGLKPRVYGDEERRGQGQDEAAAYDTKASVLPVFVAVRLLRLTKSRSPSATPPSPQHDLEEAECHSDHMTRRKYSQTTCSDGSMMSSGMPRRKNNTSTPLIVTPVVVYPVSSQLP